MKALITCSIVVMLSACSSVTIQPQKIAKLSDKPTYQDSRPFFMWGLVGEERVNVKKVCGDQTVVQMQSQQTLLLLLLRPTSLVLLPSKSKGERPTAPQQTES